jgi:hypothetical protein
MLHPERFTRGFCDTYSHVVAGMHEDAAEQVAALFRTSVSNPLAEDT